jgi:DNA-binding transcriptional LysR family regulator
MHKTAYGAALAQRARVILDELRQAEGEITDLLEDRRQRLSIGAFFVAMPVLLPRAIARLTATAPRCLFAVQEGDMHELLGGLHNGDFEVIVGRLLPEHIAGDITGASLYEERLLAVARPGHPLSRESDLRWTRLRDFPWVLPPKHSPVRAQLQSLFQSSGTSGPQAIVEALSVPTTLGLIRDCDAIGLLPETLAFAAQQEERLVILGVALPALPAPMSAAWLSARPLPPLAHAFVEALQVIAGELRNEMKARSVAR